MEVVVQWLIVIVNYVCLLIMSESSARLRTFKERFYGAAVVPKQ